MPLRQILAKISRLNEKMEEILYKLKVHGPVHNFLSVFSRFNDFSLVFNGFVMFQDSYVTNS